ncbi:Non-structural maintenance of chromosomes element 1 [Neolecta irregularis DAH-3]|uniref:Non-structural maintenance of chromosomes element 1 homolog n=1 Tax=Neolecta irregularis (strain DAH-3) TaxID=1198029 RepID=A0A1U7LH70_NEOID|nr:Non-structural maintenance of chromosomes element 1 [Neolecta irregularis DAH-3]|eukprot:OLL21997.1 Non-structural maintenance of chromosomes element 1 [Neolecta irregularis DAH-3]
MIDNEDDGYSDTHRAFLQAFIAARTLNLATAKSRLALCLSAQDGRQRSPQDIEESLIDIYVSAIKDKIQILDLDIVKTRDEADGSILWVFVNAVSDAATQSATSFDSAYDLPFLRKLLDNMFRENNTNNGELMSVTSTEALHHAKSCGLSMLAAENLLSKLVKGEWLCLSDNGSYSLSPRAAVELRNYLRLTYANDSDDEEDQALRNFIRIKDCGVCKTLVTRGFRCLNNRCTFYVHEHCSTNLSNSKKCPSCNNLWRTSIVGPNATRSGHERSTFDGALEDIQGELD